MLTRNTFTCPEPQALKRFACLIFGGGTGLLAAWLIVALCIVAHVCVRWVEVCVGRRPHLGPEHKDGKQMGQILPLVLLLAEHRAVATSVELLHQLLARFDS